LAGFALTLEALAAGAVAADVAADAPGWTDCACDSGTTRIAVHPASISALQKVRTVMFHSIRPTRFQIEIAPVISA
jgi:hypothetical protein